MMSVELPITVHMEWAEANKLLTTEAARRLGLTGTVKCDVRVAIVTDSGREQIDSVRFTFQPLATTEEGR